MKRPSLPLWMELAAALFIALLLSNLATIAFVQVGGELRFQRFSTAMQADRIAATAKLILDAPEPLRRELPSALSSPGLTFSWSRTPLVTETMSRALPIQSALQRSLSDTDIRAHTLTLDERDTFRPPAPPRPPWGGPQPPGASPPLPDGSPTRGGPQLHGFGPAEAPGLIVSIQTSDGSWINVTAGAGPPPPRMERWPFIYAVVTTLLALLLAAIFMEQRVARPLHVLSEAATRLRRGETGPPVPETGPAPVQEAARAFNAMSERVSTTLRSQQSMMAAIAHDLRTPIAVLRVRAEFVKDEETRQKLLATIAEMQQMTEAVLSALRIDGSGEPAQTVDLGALAESLCVDMEELGRDVRYLGGPQVSCLCRVGEIRRALGNLVDNAVRYGMKADVSIEQAEGSISIHVDDEGPGIPLTQLARVFEPFARLEESRNTDTGGHGLGLSIARLIARGHRGDVTLSNRHPKGLRATLSLPAA